MARLTGLELAKLTSAMYEIRCLYTLFYAQTEINGGLKRYCLALAWHSSAKNKNQILDSVGRKRAAMPYPSVVYMQLYTEVVFRKDSLTESLYETTASEKG